MTRPSRVRRPAHSGKAASGQRRRKEDAGTSRTTARHGSGGATAKRSEKEPAASDETAQATEGNIHLREAQLLIKKLDELGLGEAISKDDFLDYYHQLPSPPPCAHLSDYQRLVLRNYGGTEYGSWSEYHRYIHSYKIEQEYVKYCEELSKQLKWMEDYLHFDRPSFKWDFISSRGALQAIKIAATGFHEITPSLAYNGYYECTASMSYDLTWFKELDGVYLEIWRRVSQQMKSFRDALEEVHNLNRFPLRQHRMKHALEFDDSRKEMEDEYHTCTAAITSEVEEEEVRELIAEAVKKQPKSYEQYIRKKIDIAHAIGIIPEELE